MIHGHNHADLALLLAKPVATAAVATGIQKFMFPGYGLPYAAAFGASVGAGVLAADLASSQIQGSRVSRSIEQRAMEVGLGVGSGLAIHKFVLGGELYDIKQRVAVAAAAEVLGEFISNSFIGA